MAEPRKIKVMISSRASSRVAFSDGDVKLIDLRSDVKTELAAIELFGSPLFDVTTNETAAPGSGSEDSWQWSLRQIREADIVLVLYNGDAGFALEDRDVGICHAEFMEAMNRAQAKVRMVSLPEIKPRGRSKKRNELFQAYVKSQSLFSPPTTTRTEAMAAIEDALRDAIGQLVELGVMGAAMPEFVDRPSLDADLLDTATGAAPASDERAESSAAPENDYPLVPTHDNRIAEGEDDPRPALPMRLAASSRSPAEGAGFDADVQFTVYRPRIVATERWYQLLSFVHKSTSIENESDSTDPLKEVSRLAAQALGAQSVDYGSVAADSSAVLRRGNELVFEPWLEAGRIEPRWAALTWNEPVHQVLFRFQVPATSEGRRLAGGLRVFGGPLLLGEVNFQLSVDSATSDSPHEPQLAETVHRYRRIFASYSHRDADLVSVAADFARLSGDDYLIDSQSIRSGEEWERRLEELIEEADIFQLFWSHNAMRSEFVRKEWEYALGLGREKFIRPVYWEYPLPKDTQAGLPPAELLKIHFHELPIRFAALLDKADTQIATAPRASTHSMYIDGYPSTTSDNAIGVSPDAHARTQSSSGANTARHAARRAITDDLSVRIGLARLADAATMTYYDAMADAADAAAYYSDFDFEQGATALYNRLHELVANTHHTTLSYKTARLEHLYAWIDLHPNDLQLAGLYSQQMFDPASIIEQEALVEAAREQAIAERIEAGEVDREFLEDLEAIHPFNCEHVVPQSWFDRRKQPKADLHHLFTCEWGCKSKRGNRAYDQFNNPQPDLCGQADGNRFEPANSKGPAARATLYFLLRYTDEIAKSAKEMPRARLDTILQWDAKHPVTLWEQHRNAEIAKVQGNRNPFIDHPGLSATVQLARGLKSPSSVNRRNGTS